MYYQNKDKNSTIPRQWFFFNPERSQNTENLGFISKKIGVVFFNESLETNKFLLKIKPYVNLCRQKNIKFIIPFSIFWANKYKAFGLIVDLNKKRISSFTKKLCKRYFLVSKIHNLKEARLAKQFVDLVFISPAFTTTSYPNKNPLRSYIFISLCFFFRRKFIFALGGVNYENFKFLKNKNLYGFGAINCFRKEYEKV